MVVKVTLSENMAAAARERAVVEGKSIGNDPGIASIIRRALRDYLSKNGYKVDFLDGNDKIVADGQPIDSGAFPSARNGH